MARQNTISFLILILIHILTSLEAVKIGVSKTSSTTTTLAPMSATTVETTTIEQTENESSTTTTSTTSTVAPKPTTAKTATTEAEWPEFPPKKTTNNKSTTTRKPTRSTKKPTTTTLKPTTTTMNPEIANKTEGPTEALVPPKTIAMQQQYCFCDLSFNTCDINCCCDADCSADALKVFKCLKDNTEDFEIHEGRFEDFKFQHGLPSCEVNDGWLCVFRSNVPPAEKKASSSYADTSSYYKWPNLLKDNIERENREFYIYGDAVKLINVETRDVQNFELPSSFKPPHCRSKEPIEHLKAQKRTCLIANEQQFHDIQQQFWELEEKYKVFQKPTLADDIYTAKKLNDFGNITIRWCNETLGKCSKITKELQEDSDKILNKIGVNILHNFTNLHEIVIDLWHHIKEETDPEELWLIFEVKYVNKTSQEMLLDNNATVLKDNQKTVSGPLGYAIGRPIIYAKYVPVNQSLPLTEKNGVLNYFAQNDTASSTLSIFKKEQGFCRRYDLLEDQEFISFGINLAKQCKTRMDNDSFLNDDVTKTNFTIICLTLQNLINYQLFGPDLELSDISSNFISQLGKPQNITNKWLPLNVYNLDFNTVFGQYLENSNTFICRNILLSLSYEFHIGSFVVNDVPEQYLIKHASLIMGEKHDLEFSLEENIVVPLSMTVRFYDLNGKAASAGSYMHNYILMYFTTLLVLLNV